MNAPRMYNQPGWRVGQVIQVAGSATFGQAEIDWKSIDYQPNLERLRTRFAAHLGLETAKLDDAATRKRYLDLRMRRSKIETTASQAGGTYLSFSLEPGTWRQLVTDGDTVLLVGELGSGKTTSLLSMADALAQTATNENNSPFPLYVPLNTFAGGDADTLKTMAAYASGLEPRVLDALWGEQRRPLWLLLDGADEVSTVQFGALTNALEGLLNLRQDRHHTLVIACRTGPAQKAIENALASRLTELALLPLSDTDIDQMLEGYGAPALRDLVKAYPPLQRVVQNPGQLAALARSMAGGGPVLVPYNHAQVFTILLEYHLFGADRGDYDYARVKRPVLAFLAYTMLLRDQSYLPDDDALYELIAGELTQLGSRYEHRQRVMPFDWSAQKLIEELIKSSVLTRTPGAEAGISFSDQNYRDYYAALYLREMEADPATLDAIRLVFDPERWLAPMIFLVALYPEAGALFDMLYAPQPQTATELWFEKRPYEIRAPRLIRESYGQRLSSLGATPLARLDEPVTGQLLVDMLGNAAIAKRLKAARALTQWGASAIGPLLDAAEDDHALVQAVAQYALLHTGESAPGGEVGRPLPPFLDADGRRFSFRGFGGSNARVGPLTLVQGPLFANVLLSLDVDQVGFDPFTAPAVFTLIHTPPAILAASLFAARARVDWIDLAAQCRWIADHSTAISRQAEPRSRLAGLVAALRLRAAHYDQLGRFLAADLGIEWPRGDAPESPPWVEEDVDRTYRQLRRLYSRTNQSRYLASAGAPGEAANEVTQSIALIRSATANAFVVEEITLAPGEESPTFVRLEPKQQVKRMDRGTLAGVAVGLLRGVTRPLPVQLSIKADISVDHARRSTIVGMRIGKLSGDPLGWRADIRIDVVQLQRSAILGIVIDQDESSGPAGIGVTVGATDIAGAAGPSH